MPIAGGKRSAPIGRLVALALSIGVLGAAELARSHREATSAAERSAAGLVRLLAEQTERTVQAIDFTLIGMRDGVAIAPGLPHDDPAFRGALQERLKSLPYVRALFVIGPDGYVIHDTDYPETPHVNLADRLYFSVHRSDPGIGLHIGRPLRSRSVGAWFISITRRITNADGSFGGVVVAAVEPRYFKRFYADLSIGDGGVIALLLDDGTLLARMPHHDAMVGTSYADSVVYRKAQVHGSGVTWAPSVVDQVTRIVGYRTLAGGALIVVAGWSSAAVYESWREHALVVGVASFLVWLLASGLMLLGLKYRRQVRLERARSAQVQRLEMMGRIAGGIAHDLGNTIKIARTTFTLLKPSLTSQQSAIELVEDADRSLKSAFDIIDRLLAFARRQELSPRPTDLAELICGFAPILRQAVGPRVTLNLDLAKGLVCLVDPIHLESALLNLVLNSRDAMPDGGSVVVELREIEAPGDRRKGRGRRAAGRPWAQIVVKDSGAGMSRDVQERAFEPFFTTRTGGSGLGLSQVLGFVQQSSGEVRIESRAGGGTAVILKFPTTSSPVEAARSSAPSIPAAGPAA